MKNKNFNSFPNFTIVRVTLTCGMTLKRFYKSVMKVPFFIKKGSGGETEER